MVEEFLMLHDETEICLIQNDYDDQFCPGRVSYMGVSAWPTVVGNGLSDAWPLDCLEGDYEAHNAIPSPLTLTISTNGLGDFTAHLTAEEDVVDAYFFMVATLDEEVPGYSGTSHLPHHVKEYMTPLTGDPFTLLAGESIDINHSFVVQPEWDYGLMGVAAWVSRPGGVNTSPCTYGDIGNKNEVLQSRWVTTSDPAALEEITLRKTPTLRVFPNPGIGQRTITYTLPHAGHVRLGLYDAQGRLVEQLPVQESAGSHTITWSPSASRGSGSAATAGVRFIRLELEGQILTKEILLIQ